MTGDNLAEAPPRPKAPKGLGGEEKQNIEKLETNVQKTFKIKVLDKITMWKHFVELLPVRLHLELLSLDN